MPTKKKTSIKKATKKVARKKPAAKKVAAKKVATKKVARKKPAAKKIMSQVIVEPNVEVILKDIKSNSKDPEVSCRVVYMAGCSNCEHLPFKAKRVVAVLGISAAVLSGLLLSNLFVNSLLYI